MPIHRFQTEDGKIHRVEAATREEAEAELNRVLSAPPKKRGPIADTMAAGGVAWGDLAGAMANFNRGLGIGDELAAGFGTAGDLLTGKTTVPGIPAAFRKNMARQRAIEDAFMARHPKVANLAKGVGMAVTAAVPVGQSAALAAASPRLVNAARGAVTAGLVGAGYAAADRGSAAERLQAASSTASNPLVLGLGAGAGALGPALPGKQTAAKTLRNAGVNLTPGQRLSEVPVIGPLAKNAEDLAQRAPILGPAISGARQRGNDSLMRAVGLEALAPVGKKLPKEVRPGFDMVKYVDDQLGTVYDEAAKIVPRVAPDAQLADDIARIGERKVDLPEHLQSTFDGIIQNRLSRLSGQVTGKQLKAIHAELGGVQRQYAGRGGAEAIMGEMIGDVRRSMMGLLGRADPRAAELVAKADQGWAVYSMMNKAAAAAQGRQGVFTPGQLGQQVVQSGNKYSNRAVGRGEAKLQQLSSAAQKIMPDQFGNPGTANAIGLGGLLVGVPTNPVATAGTVAGLSAAASPYLLMGRKIVEELPANATVPQLQSAAARLEALAARDPAAAAMYRQVAARLASAVGVGAGAASAPGWAAQGVEALEVGGKIYWPDGRVTDAQP